MICALESTVLFTTWFVFEQLSTDKLTKSPMTFMLCVWMIACVVGACSHASYTNGNRNRESVRDPSISLEMKASESFH